MGIGIGVSCDSYTEVSTPFHVILGSLQHSNEILSLVPSYFVRSAWSKRTGKFVRDPGRIRLPIWLPGACHALRTEILIVGNFEVLHMDYKFTGAFDLDRGSRFLPHRRRGGAWQLDVVIYWTVSILDRECDERRGHPSRPTRSASRSRVEPRNFFLLSLPGLWPFARVYRTATWRVVWGSDQQLRANLSIRKAPWQTPAEFGGGRRRKGRILSSTQGRGPRPE
mmetsp:Transcript_21853/g.72230  ORF Transcript_21853/g.72230 Transcript_21853/m.72230 type:complete len:224 (+) Transcript_21853:419-1090(+)